MEFLKQYQILYKKARTDLRPNNSITFSNSKSNIQNLTLSMDGDVESTYADVSGLMKDFGYKPDTKLADGIGEFVKWHIEFYGEKNER